MADRISEFIAYFNNLKKAKGTCHIFERNDGYSLYGDDALLINQEILKASKVKIMHSGDETLSYVNISKGNFIQALKYLLFVRQYKIEILRNSGNIRTSQWTVTCKASPGNLTAIEDLLFGDCDSYAQESRGIMAVKMLSDGSEQVLGIAYCDPILREIQICQLTDNSELLNLQSVLVQLSPQECLLPTTTTNSKLAETAPRFTLQKIIKAHGVALSECKPGDFSATNITQDLNRLLNFEEGMDFNSMKEESEMKVALAAVASIVKYLELLADEHNFGQFSLSVFKSNQYAKVDMQTISGLGLFPENSKDFHENHYLFGHLNSCFSSLGERLLVQWIKQPLLNLRILEERLDIVEIFVSSFSLQNETSKYISKFPDIETLSRKIQRRKASLQDLYKIYMMLIQLPELHITLSKYDGPHADVLKSNFVEELKERIGDFKNFISMIDSTLDFEALKNKEFIIKAEYSEELLELKKKMTDVQKSVNKIYGYVQEDLDIATVKLECCKNIGYVFRVTRKEEKHLRKKTSYTVIDTKASGIRFQNAELKNLNERYLSLLKSYEGTQKIIVDQLIDVAVSYTQPLKLLSHVVAWLDVALAFARVSVNAPKQYVRPKLKEKGDCHIILKQARHPVLESRIENFIPNDVEITKEKHMFYFVTGPNMGGKSTYIRSVALNVLLAQIGCFVPCDEAEISLTDAFLTRIGACDKPSKAMSTFMFEMLEVQTIIKSATSASLLIIDEMGRGTSTYDGFGLSWAISRHIAEVLKAPCLFATHFHELTDLSQEVPNIGNLYVEALSSDHDIIFLYNVKPGVCDESFGIHVSKLASFPEEVIKKAEEKLKELDEAHMPISEILSKFSSVPGGQVILENFQQNSSASFEKSFKEKDDVDFSDHSLSTGRIKGNFSQLENLTSILEDLVKEHMS